MSMLISEDDYELAEAALACARAAPAGRLGYSIAITAMRMLRDECGWTLRKAKAVIELVQAAG